VSKFTVKQVREILEHCSDDGVLEVETMVCNPVTFQMELIIKIPYQVAKEEEEEEEDEG
jgi:hypothetical protein